MDLIIWPDNREFQGVYFLILILKIDLLNLMSIRIKNCILLIIFHTVMKNYVTFYKIWINILNIVNNILIIMGYCLG